VEWLADQAGRSNNTLPGTTNFPARLESPEHLLDQRVRLVQRVLANRALLLSRGKFRRPGPIPKQRGLTDSEKPPMQLP
jgi:hypothetical protein